MPYAILDTEARGHKLAIDNDYLLATTNKLCLWGIRIAPTSAEITRLSRHN